MSSTKRKLLYTNHRGAKKAAPAAVAATATAASSHHANLSNFAYDYTLVGGFGDDDHHHHHHPSDVAVMPYDPMDGGGVGLGSLQMKNEEEEEDAADGTIAEQQQQEEGAKNKTMTKFKTKKTKNEELYSHFVTLPKKYAHANVYMCTCLYCTRAYNTAVENQKAEGNVTIPSAPKEIRRTQRDCTLHLKRCKHYHLERSQNNNISNISGAADAAGKIRGGAPPVLETKPSKAQRSASASVPSFPVATAGGPKQHHSIRQYMIPPMRDEDVSKLEERLVEMVVACALPFHIVDLPSFKRFIAAIRPSADLKLPGRTKLKEHLLTDLAMAAKQEALEDMGEALSRGHHPGMIVDISWKYGSQTMMHLQNVFAKVGDGHFILQSEAVAAAATASSSQEHHPDGNAIAIASGWEQLLTVDYPNYPWRYFLSADAGQCGRARRILALRHPHILFRRCWAHQVNIMVKSLLSEPTMKEICLLAMEASNTINASSSSSKWLAQFKNKVEELYGKSVSSRIFTVRETHWNSTQACLASQLRARSACQEFAVTFAYSNGFPAALQVWKEPSYWNALEEAERLIRPFCDVSYLMQREKGNTLAHVMLVILTLSSHLRDYCGAAAAGSYQEAQRIFADVEKRWSQEEHPLMFLAFALHPQTRHLAVAILKKSMEKNGNWNDERNVLSVTRLANAAKFYYAKYRLHLGQSAEDKTKEEQRLFKTMKKWLHGNVFDDLSQWLDDENVSMWWGENSDEFPEVARLARFLMDCPIQGSVCERLFKDFTQFHPNERMPATKPETVYNQTLVKYMMRKKYPEDSVAGVGTFTTKNRIIIQAAEYVRIDHPLSLSDRAAMEAKENDSEEANLAQEEGQEEEFGDDEEQSAAALDCWLQAFESVVGEDGEDYVYEEGDTSCRNQDFRQEKECNSSNENDSDGDNLEEDSYEVAPEVLQPLPLQDDRSFPQENAAYFHNKNYVRNDKYSLDKLLIENVELPTLMSIYNL